MSLHETRWDSHYIHPFSLISYYLDFFLLLLLLLSGWLRLIRTRTPVVCAGSVRWRSRATTRVCSYSNWRHTYNSPLCSVCVVNTVHAIRTVRGRCVCNILCVPNNSSDRECTYVKQQHFPTIYLWQLILCPVLSHNCRNFHYNSQEEHWKYI